MFERFFDVLALKQELAEVRMGLAVSGIRLYGAPKGSYGAILVTEQPQRVAQIVVRRSKTRIQPDRFGKDVACLAGFAVFHKRDAQVIHGSGVLEINQQRRPARLDRVLPIAELPVCFPQVGIEIGIARERDRPQDSLNGEPRLSRLQRQNAG